MKALIQKDLRENLKIALIGLLIFSLMLMQAYRSGVEVLASLLRGNWSGQAAALQPLLSTSLLIEAAFFCAIFGAALGWLQTRNEAHRDLWAFLIHRPITRTEIFWGKTIAGLCLYAFGAGLPMLVLILVVRTPGHVAAPFEWEMAMPLVTIFLTGAAYYFAGLLTGLRQARWFVSRSFGLAPAFIASLSVFGTGEFWIAYTVILIETLVLATAAWGAYQSGGWYRGQPAGGRLALTAAMATGCVVVLYAGLGMVFGLLIDPLSRHPYEYTNFQMTRDGTIYKVTQRDGELVEIADLDGHPLMDPKTGRPMERKEFQKNVVYGGYVFSMLNQLRSNQNAFQGTARFFTLVNVTDKTLWYLDRHGRLTGYSGRTRRFTGSLDAHGANAGVAFEPFLSHASGTYYSYYNYYNDSPQKWLATARTAYRVDFKERTVSPVFTITNDDEIGGYAADISDYEDYSTKKLLFTTRQTIQLLDVKGNILLNVPYEPGCREYPEVQLSFLKTNSTYAVWLYPDGKLNEKAHWTMPVHVRWFGPEQTLAKTADLPFLHQDNEESWSSKFMTALLPPLVHVEFNGKTLNTWNLSSCTLTAICALIGWRLVRRYEASTKIVIGWTLFVFLLGLPGLLTLLCVQEWPVREECPQCQKLRTVDRETCEHCAAAFAPPERNGTEIFAPLLKA